ncbi:MAG: flippase-like domain-containing protein [Clostridiales bacterium]|nr:flippase-like domain-containing protein [Clostridiales bacterium]
MDKKKIFWSVFSLLLAVLSVVAVMSQSGGISIPELIEALKSAKPGWVAAAVISTACFIFLEGVAICSILKGIGYRRHLGRGLIYSTSDIYFSAITPSATGGQPASAFFMVKDGIPGGVVTVTLIVNLIMYTAGVVLLGIIALLINYKLFFGFRLLSKVLIIAGFLILSGLTFMFFMILRKGTVVFNSLRNIVNFLHRKHIIHRVDPKIAKINKAEIEYKECVEVMSGKMPTLIKAFIWNFLQRASQILVPVFMYMAMGGKASTAPMVFASQCLITIGFNCVPVPGAMGVADFLMIDGFSKLMTRDDAFRLEMLSRGISFYICVIVSGIIMLFGYIMLRRREKKQEVPL